MTYARGTTVSVERSKTEIEAILARYGATDFVRGESFETGNAWIAFAFRERYYRMLLPMPDYSEYEQTPTGRRRTEAAALAAWEQGVRERWRALALLLKANLEAVNSGILTMERAFLAHLMLPDGTRVEEWLAPQIDAAYRDGRMPPMLTAGKP